MGQYGCEVRSPERPQAQLRETAQTVEGLRSRQRLPGVPLGLQSTSRRKTRDQWTGQHRQSVDPCREQFRPARPSRIDRTP